MRSRSARAKPPMLRFRNVQHGVVGQRGRVDDGNATLRRKPEAAILCANAGGLTESNRRRAGHAVLATVQHRRDRALPTNWPPL